MPAPRPAIVAQSKAAQIAGSPPRTSESRRTMTSRSDRNTPLIVNWRPNTDWARNVIEHFWVAFTEAFPIQKTLPWLPLVRTNITMIAVGGIEVDNFTFNFHCPHGPAQFCRNLYIALIYLSSRPDTSRAYRRLKRSGVRRIVIQDLGPGRRLAPIDPKDLLKTIKTDALNGNNHIVHSDQALDRISRTGNPPHAHLHLARNDINTSHLIRPNLTIRAEPSPNTASDASCLRLHVDSRVDDFIGTAPMRGGPSAYITHISMTPKCRHLRARIRASNARKRLALRGAQFDAAQVLSCRNIATRASSRVIALHRRMAQFAPRDPARIGTHEPRVSWTIRSEVPSACSRTKPSAYSPNRSPALPPTSTCINTLKMPCTNRLYVSIIRTLRSRLS